MASRSRSDFDLPVTAAKAAPTNLTSLRGMDDKALLSHFVQQHKFMSSLGQVAANQKGPLPQEYVHEILKKEYAAHPSQEIQVLVACIIADTLRVMAPDLPFATSKLNDALSLFVRTFDRLRQTTTKKKDLPQQYFTHLSERLSIVHSLFALCKGIAADGHIHDVEDDLTSLMDAFLNHSKGSGIADDHMATILNDVLTSTNTITDQQFNLLLKALTKKSPVARSVFNHQAEKLQSVLSQHISELWDRATERLLQCDPNAEESNDEKKAALKSFSDLIEFVSEVGSTSSRSVTFVLPNLVESLKTENVELRTVLTRGLGKMFSDTSSLIFDHPTAFSNFAQRFWDSKTSIRNEMLKFVKTVFQANRSRDDIVEGLWKILADPLQSKLIDSEETVRKNSILVLMSIVSDHTPAALIRAVANRCRDKKLGVRMTAVTQLASFFTSLRIRNSAVAWIPNSIIHIYNLDEGSNVAFVEQAIHTMIASSPKFEEFCGLLDEVSVKILQSLLQRMKQLRMVLIKLFEVRSDKENRETVEKLAAFLQKTIPGTGGEWLAVLNVKDEKVFRGIRHQATSWKHMQDVVGRIKANAKKEIGEYFEKEVLYRITLPLPTTVTADLIRTMEQGREDRDDMTSCLNAMMLLGRYDPEALKDSRDTLSQWIKEDVTEFLRNDGVITTTAAKKKKSAATTERSPARPGGNVSATSTKNLLRMFQVLYTMLETEEDAPASRELIQTLGSFCLKAPATETELCKYASRCFCLAIEKTPRAAEQHFGVLLETLRNARPEDSANLTITMKELVMKYVSVFEKVSKVAIPLIRSIAVKSAQSVEPNSTASLQGALRVLTSYVMAQGEDGSADALSVTEFLVETIKINRESTNATTIAKRLVIMKQFIRILRIPTARKAVTGNGKLYQSIFVVLSAEDSKENRKILQGKLHEHLFLTVQLPLSCASLLFAMALLESDRQCMSRLRIFCRDVVSKYRGLLEQQPVMSRTTLSDLRAVAEYPEYILPRLVHSLAHHPTFRQEQTHSYPSIQRVLALFFEEVLRPNNVCASFLIEMIRKMKQLDDRWAPTSLNTKILCDVCSRVLQEVLSSKSVPADALRTYPGNVQFPNTFAPAKETSNYADKSYLPADFAVIKLGFGGFNVPTKREEAGDREQSPPKRSKSESVSAASPGRTKLKARIFEWMETNITSLTENELGKITWKSLRKQLCEALHVDSLDDELKDYVWSVLEQIQDNLA
eukprot:PhF_6_TR43164/c0_g1_i1/m.66107/K11267/PDS5; sister chromatid cohesion protein PDS5